MDAVLQQAYINTEYIVFHDQVEYSLRIHSIHNQFDLWCHTQGIDCWAIITACNPYSISKPTAMNVKKNNELKRLLLAKEYRVLSAVGRSIDGDWEPEESYFICNINFQEAKTIGRIYQQNAIVYGQKQGDVQLVIL